MLLALLVPLATVSLFACIFMRGAAKADARHDEASLQQYAGSFSAADLEEMYN